MHKWGEANSNNCNLIQLIDCTVKRQMQRKREMETSSELKLIAIDFWWNIAWDESYALNRDNNPQLASLIENYCAFASSSSWDNFCSASMKIHGSNQRRSLNQPDDNFYSLSHCWFHFCPGLFSFSFRKLMNWKWFLQGFLFRSIDKKRKSFRLSSMLWFWLVVERSFWCFLAK